MAQPLIWINACEPSGDLHGALLAEALAEALPGTMCAGMGGQAMEQAGVDLALRMEGLSVMGISEVFAYLPRVFGMWRTIHRRLTRTRPTAIVLIDSPDFHFRVARMARRLGIPVFYYISPQVWAWRPGRVAFLKKYVHRMLCILPFEPAFYRMQGMNAEYVGHPLVRELRRPELLAVSPNERRVGFLPGSRKSEIQRLMPVYAEAMHILHARDPGLELAVIRAPGIDESFMRDCAGPLPPIVRFLDPEQRYRHMRECALLIATSGTVSLESSLLEVPTIVAYQCSRLSFLVAIRLVKVPAISLTNLILGRNALPEFVQHQATPVNLAEKAWAWLQGQGDLQNVREELAKLPGLLGDTAASHNAAAIISRDVRFWNDAGGRKRNVAG